jgi:hypothetical protein
MMNNVPPQPQIMMANAAPNMLNQSQVTANSAASSTNPQYADIHYSK